ncbi:hypothetical protein Z946_291 [Sulfitobacter noctilucicola]|nr:hypothetical protein Z946_291 [Sulfitobacter noctilucicola]
MVDIIESVDPKSYAHQEATYSAAGLCQWMQKSAHTSWDKRDGIAS